MDEPNQHRMSTENLFWCICFEKFPFSGHNLIEAETSKIAEKIRLEFSKWRKHLLRVFSPDIDWFWFYVYGKRRKFPFFFVAEFEWEKKFPRKTRSNTWSLFILGSWQTKNPEKTFWIYDFLVVVVAVLVNFVRPEMKARDVPVVENIISVNYDETGEKWATSRVEGARTLKKVANDKF